MINLELFNLNYNYGRQSSFSLSFDIKDFVVVKTLHLLRRTRLF